ncbi:STAS domain-containing protein [Streptomyces sp. NBC_00212]|uniref:STAS domain-containing protein n=1 Tax=Streptomyces sp. NBC_00212 TaxID=2975684 RepID=UPI0032527850
MTHETQPTREEHVPTAQESAHTHTHTLDGYTVVELHGELDLCSAPAVREQLDAATSTAGARVIVDLRPAHFLDCTTLALICRARRRALHTGGTIGLICTHPWHLQLLQATGLNTILRPAATVEEAIAREPHDED